MLKFFIDGKPKPLQRPRLGRNCVYDPSSKDKKIFAQKVKNLYSLPPFSVPLYVKMIFYFEMPKSWPIKKKKEFLLQAHCQRPDTSNLVKFVEDALNEVLWVDDCLIFMQQNEKYWAEKSKTVIEVSEFPLMKVK